MKSISFYFLALLCTRHFADCCISNINSEHQKGKKFTKIINVNDEVNAEVNIAVKDSTTILNCSSESSMVEHCQISHGNKVCKAHFKDGKFKKIGTCDTYFEDVRFNRAKEGKTCQIIIEKTKFNHGGIWMCELRKNLKEYNIVIRKAFKVEVVKMSVHDMILIVVGVEFCVILIGLLSFTCLKYFEENPEPKIDHTKKNKLRLKAISMNVLKEKDSGIYSTSEINT